MVKNIITDFMHHSSRTPEPNKQEKLDYIMVLVANGKAYPAAIFARELAINS